MNKESNINYEGEVKITFVGKNKEKTINIKNNGTIRLQKAVSRALSGNYDREIDTPKTIVLLDSNDNNVLNSTIYLSGSVYEKYGSGTQEDPYYYANSYTAVIGYGDLNAPISSGESSHALVLVGNQDGSNDTTDFAYIQIPDSDLSNITEGVQAIIVWTMKVNI